MIGELIWILVIVTIVVWVIKDTNDFNRMVDIGVAKLAEKGKEADRWTPASELLNEMNEKQENWEQEDDELTEEANDLTGDML